MKDWKAHAIFGLLLAIVFFNFIYFFNIFEMNLQLIISLTAVVFFVSLLPDIDLRKSKIRDFVALAIAFGASLLYIYYISQTYYAIIYFFIIYFLIKFFPMKHRGTLHNFYFSIFFSFFSVLVGYFIFSFSQKVFVFWYFIVFISYNLHLFLDNL
jgi:membrane-bound metal-dependent hydrolase YbcI (DUF457 family)